MLREKSCQVLQYAVVSGLGAVVAGRNSGKRQTVARALGSNHNVPSLRFIRDNLNNWFLFPAHSEMPRRRADPLACAQGQNKGFYFDHLMARERQNLQLGQYKADILQLAEM